MSHSEALSRLTVGDRRSDLIRWVLRRAIARSSGTGSTRHDRRANVSNSQVRPGPRQSLARIVVGGTAVTFDHGWAQADEAPGPHHGSARTARRVVVSTSEAQKAYAETGLALRTGRIAMTSFYRDRTRFGIGYVSNLKLRPDRITGSFAVIRLMSSSFST
jgi:hypothetical protein